MASEMPRGFDGPIVAAWDTCTIRGILAVASAGELAAETYFEAEKGHTGWLMPQLDEMLRSMDLRPHDLDYVAAGIGPGTFTGVKVGVASAKSVAMALGVPLVGMPTLDLIARCAPGTADLVLSTIDARRGQLYAAAYRRVDGGLERSTEYQCLPPAAVCRAVEELDFAELAVVGEAAEELVERLCVSGRVVAVDEPYPIGSSTVDLALVMISMGEETDPVSLVPIYLRKPA